MRVDHYEPGVPSWVDLASPDVAKSVEFYTDLFDWTAEDQGAEAGHYTICSSDGLAVAGIGPIMGGGPPHWTTYVNVESTDDTLAKVEKAGGVTLMAPMDVMEAGRMAIAADPDGAAIGIWQPNQFAGAQLVNEPVSYSWSQLLSTDVERAIPFYESVFGWGTASDANGTSFTVAGNPVCGAMAMPAPAPPGTPSYWDVYFAVAAVDATAAHLGEHGGQILMGPQDIGPARIVSAIDPSGAIVGLAQAKAVSISSI